jgi:hypothetical protein
MNRSVSNDLSLPVIFEFDRLVSESLSYNRSFHGVGPIRSIVVNFIIAQLKC